MSGTGSNGRSEVARGAGFATAKGAGLVGLAVLIGVVLLQVVDVEPEPTGERRSSSPATTVEGDEPADPTDTPARTPDQVRVIVLNGGAPTGSAKTVSDALKQQGYTNQAEPNNDPNKRTGNVVYCQAELEREAAALVTAVGEGTTVEEFPAQPLPAVADADCIVVVGGAAS